jgi:hypothetical protein
MMLWFPSDPVFLIGLSATKGSPLATPSHPLPMTRNLLFTIALAAIALASVQQLPAQAPAAAAANAQNEAPLPVVIDYGQGEETRVNVYGGMMEPVGVLPNQSVTVTVSFPISRAGALVSLALYDGGQVGAAALPGSGMITLGNLQVPATGIVQFNFQAGRTHGLYRVLMNVGSGQYLLRFYAGRPSKLQVPPLPTPFPTPSPH